MIKIKYIILLTIVTVLFSACSRQVRQKGYSNVQYFDSELPDEYNDDAYGQSINGDLFNKQGNHENDKVKRKILYSANLSLIVPIPDSTNVQLVKIAKKYKGYSSVTGTNRTVIRVRSEYLAAAIEDIKALGKVEYFRKNGDDVTEQYYDSKIRLENAQKARERYLALLAKAENVEAALKVEKELERLNGVIDQLKGRLARMNHLEQYSTITINLKEKKKPGILGYVGLGLYYSVKWLIVRN